MFVLDRGRLKMPPLLTPTTCGLLFGALTLFGLQTADSAASVPPPHGETYQGRWFVVEMRGCVSGPTAMCTIYATARRNSSWDYSVDNRLVTLDGGSIPARSISVGGEEEAVGSHHAARMDEGIRTRIDIKFDGHVQCSDIQALTVYVGHWTAFRINMNPIWLDATPSSKCYSGPAR